MQIMKVTEKQSKVIFSEQIKGWKCDHCGNFVESTDINPPEGWHQFYRQHQGWGNDSCDSLECFDVCSIECYVAKVEEAIEEDGDELDFEVDDMTASFAKKLVTALRIVCVA